MLRIGIIGAGGIARSHANALLALSRVQLGAVHDIDGARAAELAGHCGAETAASVEELVSQSDAVFVCTWTAAHRKAVEVAAQAGRAIFCEKPLAPTMADAGAMLATVRSHGVIHQVGLPLRWRPGYALLRALLRESGERVLTAHLHTQMGNRQLVQSGWRRDVLLAGGGVLLEVGFHDLDVLEWVVGRTRSVCGATASGRSAGIEDAASLSLAFESGAVGGLVISWHDNASTDLPTRELRIVCEGSQYLLEGDARLTRFGPGSERLTLDGEGLRKAAEERGLPVSAHGAFVDAVAGAPTCAIPTFEDAMRVHILVDGVYRSVPAQGIPLPMHGSEED